MTPFVCFSKKVEHKIIIDDTIGKGLYMSIKGEQYGASHV
jgi:hypothetical protein